MNRRIEEDPGQLLAKWRKVKGMTRNQLARKAKMSPVYLLQLEQGMKRGTPNTWIKLANALEVPIGLLLKGSAQQTIDTPRESGHTPCDQEKHKESNNIEIFQSRTPG